jgi:hypothetical protein
VIGAEFNSGRMWICIVFVGAAVLDSCTVRE